MGSPDMNGHLMFTYVQHKPSVPTSQRTKCFSAIKFNHLKLFITVCSDHIKK